MKIVNVDPTGASRVIGDTGQIVAHGDEAEVDDAELAERLLEQKTIWAKPTTKAAKAAIKEGS